MNGEYAALLTLKNSDGYRVLCTLWAMEGQKIMEGLQRAAAKGQESAWRYYAGQMKGFDLAITHLERALLHMAKEAENAEEEKTTDQILKEIRDIRGQKL